MLKVESDVALPNGPERYLSIAYDGCWFYLTKQCTKEIIRLDHCFQEAGCFPTRRYYSCLCYDPHSCCFWASEDQCHSVIYQLDECFREINRLILRIPETHMSVGAITGISYDYEEKKLLLSTAVGLVWLPDPEDHSSELYVRKSTQWITGVLAAGRDYFYCYMDEGRQVVRYCSDCGKVLWECPVPREFYIESAVLARCPKREKGCCLYALAYKNGCYPYLLRCTRTHGTFCCDFSRFCHQPHFPDPSGGDVMASVALVETALSHILNTEGEKLQKVIASTDDPRILLRANQSVNRTLVDAMYLEQVLYHKLDLLQDICDPREPDCD